MTIVQLLLGLLPPSRLKNRLLGLTARTWSIAASARIHPVLLWHVGTLRVGEGAYVGAGNTFRDCSSSSSASGPTSGSSTGSPGRRSTCARTIRSSPGRWCSSRGPR
jgi:hypothetical protein